MSFEREMKRRQAKMVKEVEKKKVKFERRELIKSQKQAFMESESLKFNKSNVEATVSTLDVPLLENKLSELGSDYVGIKLSFASIIYPILVSGSFNYRCEHCGYETKIYLQEGVEQVIDGIKKFVTPFSIGCPKCKEAFMNHVDWHKDSKFSSPMRAPSNCDVFIGTKESEIAMCTSLLEYSSKKIQISSVLLADKNIKLKEVDDYEL